MEQQGNGSEEEFEDSRDYSDSGDQIEPPTSVPDPIPGPAEVTAPLVPTTPSVSLGGPISSGEVDINQASVAIHAAKTEAQQCHQELLHLSVM